MRRRGRFRFKLWWLRLLHVLPAALLGLLLFYWVVTSSWFLRYAVLPRLSQVTEMPLSARSVDFELWQGRLTLTDFAAGNEDSGLFFCRGKTLTAHLRYRELWRGVIALDDISTAASEVRITIPVGKARSGAPAASRRSPLQVHLTRLAASDSRLQLIWEHQLTGQRFDLRLREIDATMDQLRNGAVSKLEFACRPDYTDDWMALRAGRAHGDWQLEFDERLHLTGSDWSTFLEDGAGRFGGFDWPASPTTSRIQFRDDKWNFVELRGKSSAPDYTGSSFDIAGALSLDGFAVAAGSKLHLTPPLLRDWFGETGGAMNADLTVEGAGSYRRPAGKIRFDWRHRGSLDWAGSLLDLPPFRAAGEFRIELDRDNRSLTLADTDITVTPGEAADAIRLQVPTEHPVTYHWGSHAFADHAGQIRLLFQQLPVTLLTRVFPLPSGWELAAGTASGQLSLETLAGTPQLGATGEITAAALTLETPAGPGEAGDLYLGFALTGTQTQWRLPRWHLSYRRDGRELMRLDGKADWNVQEHAVDFRLEAPLLEKELLPPQQQEQFEAWQARLKIQDLQGVIQGRFRPGILHLDQLEFNSGPLRLALEPQNFSAGTGWDTTRWRLTLDRWPMTETATLSGNAGLEWQQRQLRWSAAWHLDNPERLGALDGTCDGGWNGDTGQLTIHKLTWDGPEAGSGSVLPFVCDWESRRLLSPLQLDWQDLKPRLLLPPLHEGMLAGKAVLLQESDRWQAAVTLESTAPFFAPLPQTADWPLAPTAHILFEWPFDSPEVEVRATLEQNTGSEAPQYDLNTEFRWNPATGAGAGEIGILALRPPQNPLWSLHHSELKLQFRPHYWEVTGQLWAAISDYLQASAEVRLTATPEAVTLSQCDGRVTTPAAEPALVWTASAHWGLTAPEQTDIELRIKKWNQPLLQRPEDILSGPAAEAATATTPAQPWQFDFGPRLWQCRFRIDDFTPVAGISGKADGNWKGQGGVFEFQASQLSCNGAEMQLDASLCNIADDYPQFTLRLLGVNLDTAIWWQSLYHRFSTNSGIIRQVEMELAGSAAPPPRFWDDLTGRTEMRLETVDIENQFQQTTIGQLLFLPLEAYLRIRTFLPGGSGGWIPQVGGFNRDFLSLFQNTRRFTFDRGAIRLTGADGLITVEQFDFYGTDIDHLQFAGTVGCGSRRLLDLNSTIDFQGLIVPLELSGTLEEPQVQWDETTLRIFSDNAVSWSSRLLDTGAELLSTGTELFSSGK